MIRQNLISRFFYSTLTPDPDIYMGFDLLIISFRSTCSFQVEIGGTRNIYLLLQHLLSFMVSHLNFLYYVTLTYLFDLKNFINFPVCRLMSMGLYKTRRPMFKSVNDPWYNPGIEDDHIPFLERGEFWI